MSQDKEREIQLQFLEEASEYLDTIESVLLGLASSHIDGQKVDAVLRAAHSVKGGAGMMGFVTLSQLAHRMEDSFKVLKQERNSLTIDAQLESLLLSGMDCLRQVLTRNRQGTDVTPQWLETVGNPVFEQLHERLGDPGADDAATMLGPDEGTNVAALLFETEVEGCLNRLESVLADPQAPCLEEELSIMAQELGGLGEMLQLEAFTQLCEAVLFELAKVPGQVREIAGLALSAWRRSQALVLVGQISSLPTAIDIKPDAATSVTPATSKTEVAIEPTIEEVFATEFELFSPTAERPVSEPTRAAVSEEDVVWHPALDRVPHEVQIKFPTSAATGEEPATDESFVREFDDYPAAALPDTAMGDRSRPESPEVLARAESPTEAVFDEQEALASSSSTSLSRDVLEQEAQSEVPLEAFNWQEVKPDTTVRVQPQPRASAPQARQDTAENTVRIPVKQLDRLNDLFGELTIERNGLSLHLGRLRNLMEILTRRVSNLERSNSRLRAAYDTVTTQSAFPTARQSLVTTNVPNGGGSPPKSHYRAYFEADEKSDRPDGTLVGRGDQALNINSGFDALEMDRYNDLHLLSMEVMETIVQVQEVTSDLGLSLEETDGTARELTQTSKQLQTNLTRLRMRPLSELVGRFSRALREMQLQYGKQVELKVSGKGTLIDRSILEALSDPLMHLVRNAFDHGIEDPTTRLSQGKTAIGVIEIKAAHRGNQTIITVSDDGNGINLNKIRQRAEAMGLDAGLLAAASEDELMGLIFEPGFSTADVVTNLSGRGVGMDVVRNNLSGIRGDIRVDTRAGRGTTFTLTVPFTLSVARVLLVESNGCLCAFPTSAIEEIQVLKPELVLTTLECEVLNLDGEMVPLFRLANWLNFHTPRQGAPMIDGVPTISAPTVLMISQGEELYGIAIDRCWGEQEVTIRQVTGRLALPQGMSSCCVLGDGRVVPLIDTGAMISRVRQEPSVRVDFGVSAQSKPSPNVVTNPVTARTSVSSPNTDIHPQDSHDVLVEVKDSSRWLSRVEQDTSHDVILVVDDSINVRRFLALALDKAGYLVEQAKDGQDAVEKLLGGLSVCAVICDIEMPRLDGYGFLARIKSDKRFSELPVAMLTSRSGEKHRQLAMTLGAAAYFSKPYNERELLGTMKQLIRERS